MKYKVKPVKESEPPFKPFTVTLTIETHEEWKFFHDKIMGKLLTALSHEFFGAIFTAGQGKFDKYGSGSFPIPTDDE